MTFLPGTLTFEQVKKARRFAWHERFYLFANDTLLRVIAPHDGGVEHLPPAMAIGPSALRGTENLLGDGWHHLEGCTCPYCSSASDAPRLEFEQVKRTRAFAWHDRGHLFAHDTLLEVFLRERSTIDATRYDPATMVVRPSVLLGTEHLIDEGWHHLDDCGCRYCSTGHHDAGLGRQTRDQCRGPRT